MNENELAKIVVDLCLKIHKTLGPGLLESVYESALCYELKKAGIPFDRQKPVDVFYDHVRLDVGFRADIIIDNKLIIELKSSDGVTSVHVKILLTYLKMTKMKLGLMINFREELLRNGIRRVVNNL